MRKLLLITVMSVMVGTIYAQKKIGYEINVNLGYGLNSETEGDYTYLELYGDSQFAVMYQPSKMFGVGIGVGVGAHSYIESDDYDSDSESFLTIPIMLKTRFTPGNDKVRFVLRGDVGMEFIPDAEDSSYLVVYPQVGVMFNNRFNLLAGYRHTIIEDTDGAGYTTLGLGWSF